MQEQVHYTLNFRDNDHPVVGEGHWQQFGGPHETLEEVLSALIGYFNGTYQADMFDKVQIRKVVTRTTTDSEIWVY